MLSFHASAILKELWEQMNPDASRLMNQLGLLPHAKALDAEAEPLMRRALGIFNKSLGNEHPNPQTVLSNYKGLLSTMNLNQEQIEAKLREALGN